MYLNPSKMVNGKSDPLEVTFTDVWSKILFQHAGKTRAKLTFLFLLALNLHSKAYPAAETVQNAAGLQKEYILLSNDGGIISIQMQ